LGRLFTRAVTQWWSVGCSVGR